MKSLIKVFFYAILKPVTLLAVFIIIGISADIVLESLACQHHYYELLNKVVPGLRESSYKFTPTIIGLQIGLLLAIFSIFISIIQLLNFIFVWLIKRKERLLYRAFIIPGLFVTIPYIYGNVLEQMLLCPQMNPYITTLYKYNIVAKIDPINTLMYSGIIFAILWYLIFIVYLLRIFYMKVTKK